jgi:Putative Actinobacterial Holin-X, holin superfamily III
LQVSASAVPTGNPRSVRRLCHTTGGLFISPTEWFFRLRDISPRYEAPRHYSRSLSPENPWNSRGSDELSRAAKLARRLHSVRAMSDRVPEHDKAGTPNLGQLLESTLHHAKELLQAEASLARKELSTEVTSALGSIGLLAVGVMFLQGALTTLGVVLVLAFGVGIAAMAVVAALAAIGVAFLIAAVRGLERRKLPRTTARLALDAQQVMETVK